MMSSFGEMFCWTFLYVCTWVYLLRPSWSRGDQYAAGGVDWFGKWRGQRYMRRGSSDTQGLRFVRPPEVQASFFCASIFCAWVIFFFLFAAGGLTDWLVVVLRTPAEPERASPLTSWFIEFMYNCCAGRGYIIVRWHSRRWCQFCLFRRFYRNMSYDIIPDIVFVFFTFFFF